MAVSMRDLDPAFQGAGQKAGLEIWRIENFRPVPVPKSSYGKFFTGDSYVVLKTTSLKSGALRHDIHYWLGKDTSQDEAGAAAIKTVELDAALGGRAVQYREVPFARSSLSHDDIFILDTKSKIFQFNGSNSSIQERAKALEVVQYIKDTYHDGKCDVAAIEDGKLMADADTGEFWGFFGGFAPLPRKTTTDEDKIADSPTKLFWVEKGQAEPVDTDSLTRELLDTYKCYILDCGLEVFVWMGRNTSLDERKVASGAAEELVRGADRPKSHIIRVIEGFETVMFRSKFESWPETTDVAVSEDGRGKVAALLRRQGVNVKGLLKAAPAKEEPQPYIDVTGNLQVWRVDGKDKVLLDASDHSKFYGGDCYIFQYSYPGEDKEEYLIGTWFGKKSVEEERASAISLASKMVESLKFLPSQVVSHASNRFYQNVNMYFLLALSDPILQLFLRLASMKEMNQFSSLQSCRALLFLRVVLALDTRIILRRRNPDETYKEDSVALFRVQGSGDNMQSIQVEPVASSLNSSYCYILHNDSSVFTWSGNLTTSDDHELVERQLDLIKPNVQSKPQKEGSESEQFWDLLGGKTEYPSQKIGREAEKDPRLFSCTFSNGQEVDSRSKLHALTIGEKFLENDFLLEKLSRETPIYIVMEGSEPPFFTRFFEWDSAKSAMHGNSFQRKLAIVKNGGTPIVDKPKRRTPVSYGGRSSVPEKSQRSRSMSFSPERVRVRGRSPAFSALAANFENPNARNLSTPPPVVRKLYPRSVTPDSAKQASKSAAITRLVHLLNNRHQQDKLSCLGLSKRALKDRNQLLKNQHLSQTMENSISSRIESLTIQEDVKEGEVEDEEGLPIFPYERLKISSTDPVTEIDVTKRETYLSSAEFREKFGMAKDAFYKMPKWKQNKLKMALQLF
ncbi:hypothetical protein GH714_004387 [Hevea brasiliensis]|uniref:HP domain-containing protein n=1 Tax=Hevea brasiliensis TaxID=3981 RepID=A0A6A6MB41_HEVBR|nr:hypothetical protein GH714_004387 [Hevea brasiliensis]